MRATRRFCLVATPTHLLSHQLTHTWILKRYTRASHEVRGHLLPRAAATLLQLTTTTTTKTNHQNGLRLKTKHTYVTTDFEMH